MLTPPTHTLHTHTHTHTGGQKVKLVLAAAMWNSPHLLIMDEPTNYLDRWAGMPSHTHTHTNYLDRRGPAPARPARLVLFSRRRPPPPPPRRESLGALATAIKEFDGGVVLISHNNEFTSTCCTETWYVANGGVDVVSAVSAWVRVCLCVCVCVGKEYVCAPALRQRRRRAAGGVCCDACWRGPRPPRPLPEFGQSLITLSSIAHPPPAAPQFAAKEAAKAAGGSS